MAENIFPKGTKVLDIVNTCQETLPYDVLLATVNNQYEDLNFILTEDSCVTLLDMRNQAANLVYQRSLTILYLNAVSHILKNPSVTVGNSLCKGLFTVIKSEKPVSDEQIKAIEARMKKLVERNIPIESMPEAQTFLTGKNVPTTGYLKYFELVRYKKGIILRFPHQSIPNKIPPFKEEEKLYSAFATAQTAESLMGIHVVEELNRKIDNGEYKEIIQISEAIHEKEIAQIADRIAQSKKRVILIAGPSSSGKTTFAKRLNIQLKVNGLNPIYLSTDDYFVERKDTPLDEKG
ncbi:MAG: nucleoside kinase, partial [Anaerovorax sp.]